MIEYRHSKSYLKLRASLENLYAGASDTIATKVFRFRNSKPDPKIYEESCRDSVFSGETPPSFPQPRLRGCGSLDSIVHRLDSSDSSGCFSDEQSPFEFERLSFSYDLPPVERDRKVSHASVTSYRCSLDVSCWEVVALSKTVVEIDALATFFYSLSVSFFQFISLFFIFVWMLFIYL